MKYPLDEIHFQELAKCDPNDICRRALCEYDREKRVYRLSVWGDEYSISLQDRKITSLINASPPHDFFQVFLINYLQTSQDIGIAGEWISEKDLPGGPTFFRGPHEIPTAYISRNFGNDLSRFSKRCEELDGQPLDMADAAFCFSITPNIALAVLYWIGDEDFPSEAKILYDKAIIDFLALDIVYALAVEACQRIGRAA